jgi:hypothetical protein
MLNEWGYKYLVIGAALGHMEMSLRVYVTLEERSERDRGFTRMPNDHDVASETLAKCSEIESFLNGQELGAIPNNVAALRAKITSAQKNKRDLHANDLLRDIDRIRNDFLYILHRRLFYSLKPDLHEFYGKSALFGEAVALKFPAARNDIEWAGNCLALGQPTACVLHLNRAMEIAIHRLARKLKVTLNAKDNMGSMLGNMTEPIKNLPDKTEAQKRRKEKWAECRTNLYHVKMAWRDPAHHGKQSYDDTQARDILVRVKGFMQQLATLL